MNQSLLGETENQNLNIHFPFNRAVITELKRVRLTVEHCFVLECLYNGNYELLDIYDNDFSDERIIGLYNTLDRKNLIIEDPNKTTHYIISIDGKHFYEMLNLLASGEKVDNKITPRKIRAEGFEEWWNLYPSNSKWKDINTGTEFTEARPLRTGKDQCRKKYDILINSGVVTHRQLIDCLKYEIKSRKLDSLKLGKNQMTFMKGSLSYLNNDAYLAYIDEIKNKPEFIIGSDSGDSDGINISIEDLYDDGGELGN